MSARILYLSYDGMTDALGQSQVLAYLCHMAAHGFTFDIISFEKPERYSQECAKVEARIANLPIRWFPLPYHKRPPVVSTLRDLRAGWQQLATLWQQQPYDIIHARGYITALLARKANKRWGARYIFDMRGWWPDEKRDAGAWQGALYAPVYRFFKRKEAQLFQEANLAVSLTYAGRDEIVRKGWRTAEQVMVVPTCVDFAAFPPPSPSLRAQVRKDMGIADETFVMLYSGSLGGNYPVEEVFRIFQQLKVLQPHAVLLLLTKTAPDGLLAEAKTYGLGTDSLKITSCPYTEVHRYQNAADVGLIVYYPTFSAIGRSPTKLGEYWASGLPVLSTAGAGDVQRIFDEHPGGGLTLPFGLQGEALTLFLQELVSLNTPPETLRAYAHSYYSLEGGCQKYMTHYRNLLQH